MTKRSKTILQTIFLAVLGIALIVYQYNGLTHNDKKAMFEAFNTIQWIWLIPIFIVSFLSHYFRALRWKQLMHPIGIKKSISKITIAVLIGYLTNLVVPRLGEITKCTIVANKDISKVDKIIGTVIIERLIDMTCFVLLIILTLIFQYQYIYEYAIDITQYFLSKIYADGQPNWALIIGLSFGGVLLLILSIYIYKKILNSKIGKFINGLKEGIISIKKVENLPLFIFNSLMIWFLYTVAVILAFKAMPDLSTLPVLSGLTIMTFGSIATIVPAPGSIAYPVIVAPVLGLYGISAGLGQAYGWVNWGIQNLTIIVFGITSILLLPIFKQKENDDKA